MGWDANIVSTEFKGKLPLQSFNQLQAAIKERCQGAGISVPAIFNSDMVKMSDMQPSNWFSLFQSTMTTLISAYVNHTDHGGDWTGQISIPAWTQATMLTAIGDLSRLAAPSSRKCAAWCYQQYKMLNMMRWADIRRFASKYSKYEKTKSSNISWVDCESQFNSTAWSDWHTVRYYPAHAYSSSYASSTWTKRGTQAKLLYSNSNFNFSLDYYLWCSNAVMDGGDFEAINNCTINAKLNLVESKTESASIEIIDFPDSAYIGRLNPQTSGVNKYNNAGITNFAITGYGFNLIAKFDGANGFTMKDW